MSSYKRTRLVIVKIAIYYVALPFLAAFGMGLILHGLVQGLSAPNKLYGILAGVVVLLFLFILVKALKKIKECKTGKFQKPRKGYCDVSSQTSHAQYDDSLV